MNYNCLPKQVAALAAAVSLSLTTSQVFAKDIQGTASGVFVNPVLQSQGAVTGVGTSAFTWGEGLNSPPSSLNFAGTAVAADIDEYFELGELTFFNGTISADTGADAVDLHVTLSITQPSGETAEVSQTLKLVNTPNTDDPIASADIVFLPLSFPQSTFTIGGYDYTLAAVGFGTVSGSGFSALDRFFVLEGGTASAQLWGRITSVCAASSPEHEKITDFGTCGPEGKKNPKWGRFGHLPDGVLVADSGEKLWIACDPAGPGEIAFHMYYMSRKGDVYKVGTCAFEAGCNSAEFWHSGDSDGNGKPDCILRTRWISRDYGDNDLYNSWLQKWELSELIHPYLDWAETTCDMTSLRVTKTDYKFEYAYGPPVTCGSAQKAEGALAQTISVDPLLGPDTEAFFAAVEHGLTNNPPDIAPMSEAPMLVGDANGNGIIDPGDLQAYTNAVGACRGDPRYTPILDGDGDGCITLQDAKFMFPTNQPPIALCTNLIVSGDTDCTAMASIDNGSFDPDGDPITVNQSPAAPYPLGTNLVTLTVTDNKGASSSCSGVVIVVDTTPPSIVCPASQIIEFQDETGAVAAYAVTASDACSPVNLLVTPVSGSRIPIGATPVQAVAVDTSGNSNQCVFTVTVLGALGVKSNVLAELTTLRSSAPLDESFAEKLDYVILHLQDSLNPAYWIDQTHLQPAGGNAALNEEKLAANMLDVVKSSSQCPVDPAILQGLIARILKSDRLLATVSVQDAAKEGLNAKKVSEDFTELAKGDEEAAAGHYANAIEHYRNAWRHALLLRL